MEAKIGGIATIRRRQTHPIGQTGALGTIFSRSGTIGIRRTTPLPRLRQSQRIREDAITIIIIFTPRRLDAVKNTGIRRITNFRTASFLTFQRSNTHGDRKQIIVVRTIYCVGTSTHGYTTSIQSTTIFTSIQTRTLIRRTTRSTHSTITIVTILLTLTQFIIFATFAHHITQGDPVTTSIIPTATGFTTIFDDNRNSITIHGTASILTFQCPETHHCRE
mmetsp:Transcript_35718/g.36189  ORF Transcript_35718/g.36189 Transcript_35718/m.36189 type:complete len:220 (+) Transcript_35718:1547-2206(+)